MSRFTPTLHLHRFTQVTPALLHSLGVQAVITDLDDTLAARDCPTPEEEVSAWVKRLTQAGIRIMIVSNNSKKRTERFASPLGIPWIARAQKPAKKAVFRGIEQLGATKETVLLLGDQLFTDAAAAKACGIRMILVDPLGRYGGWFVQLKRALETPWRKKIPYSELPEEK